MNKQALLFIKNVVFAVGANMSQIMTTMVLTMIMPKIMTVQAYSYWQLYHFYTTYLQYSSLGWCEGLYIKYGGADYHELDRGALSSQVRGIVLHELIFAALFLCVVLPQVKGDLDRYVILTGAAAYMVLRVTRFQLQTILQASNRIVEYARAYSGERILFLILSAVCIIIGKKNFSVFICAEIVSNSVFLLYAAWLCREIAAAKPCGLREALLLETELIRTGFSLSIASFLGQMMIGVVRFAIEREYGTIIFGKISLSFSMANMLVTCITAVSIVIFPVLRRLEPGKAGELYQPLRELMTKPLMGTLLAYVPASCILSLWLPQYSDSIKYLAVLLPLCIYEVRTAVLSCTYLKVMGGQKYMLYANMASLSASIFVTWITVYLLGSVDLAVLSILGLYALKSFLTECMVKRYLDIKTGKMTVQELLLVSAFVFFSWRLAPVPAFCGYLAGYGIYLFWGRQEFISAWNKMKGMIRA